MRRPRPAGSLTEMASLTSTEDLNRWAYRSLAIKNTLTAADARLVEEAFQPRLTAHANADSAAPTACSKRSQRASADIWLGLLFYELVEVVPSLGRLGWGFIIALQPPVNRADPPDILPRPLFRAARPPEIRIQQSANYGLPLINQVRIVVHCPVPLLSSQYNIRNGATRGEKNRRIIPPRVASRSTKWHANV
jgi:hypothetical protein